MTAKNILIGLGAGLAAALLFAALIGGTSLAFPLFVLSPLPISIAALGFGPVSGIVAALVSAGAIAWFLGPVIGGVFLLVFAGPIAVAAYWIGLSRSSDTPAAPTPQQSAAIATGLSRGAPAEEREWFPLAAVLFRIALIVGVALVVIGFLVQYDPASWSAQYSKAFQSWAAADGSAGDMPSQAELDQVVRLGVALVPFTLPSLVLLMLTFDSWLAARIVRMSGLLPRPWTPLWTVTLPQPAAMIFAVALVLSFMNGPIGLVASAIAGATGFAFALTGFGFLHAMLAGNAARPFLLIAVYVFSFVFVLPAAVLAFVGVADTLFHIRARRFLARSGTS